jgi:penicillin-binding protein
MIKKIKVFFRKKWVQSTFKAVWISIKIILVITLMLGFMGAAAAYGYVTAIVKDEPLRSGEYIRSQMLDESLTGFVYFNDDVNIGQLRSEEDRRPAQLADIPQVMIDATISIEDKNFETHPGIDIKALTRAVKQFVFREDVQTGGSTITQQLARRVFLTLERAVDRKVKEIFLSLRIEKYMSKDEILLAYLNKIPYGNSSSGYNVYGIKAAAKGIFDLTELKDMNLAQAAYLAGLPQSPSTYSAFTSKPEFNYEAYSLAMERQNLILRSMLNDRKITNAQYEEAIAFDVKASMAQPSKKAYTTYSYLMIEAEKQATEILMKQNFPDLDPVLDQEKYDENYQETYKKLLTGGYKIYTTIDKTIYDGMKEISNNPDNFVPDDPVKGIEQVGAIMLDNKTGAILGMIEGRDFYAEQLNHATQAYRQPGSTMKPIAAFIPALDLGFLSPGSMIDDIPLILTDGEKGYHIPLNWDGKFHGIMTARRALNLSYNIPALKIFLNQVGINKAWEYARKMGITSLTKEDNYAQTGVIGGLYKGVTVKELTGAYSTIPNQGVHQDPFLIRKITDSLDRVVYTHKIESKVAFTEQTAYLITDMLKTVVSQGTATDLKTKFTSYNKIEIAGKTGSTQEDGDAWFVGYSPDITVGVWIGYDEPIHKLTKANGQTNHAKDIWASVMNMTAERKPELFVKDKFEMPKNIVTLTVSKFSGKLPSDLISDPANLVTDIFNRKFIPTSEDNVMVKMNIIQYNGLTYYANPQTPVEFTEEKVVIKREVSITQLLKQIEEIMKGFPKEDQKPVENYIPIDYDISAPGEMDPRQDDGLAPLAPLDLVSQITNTNNLSISFTPSVSPDVVGYRIYRSVNDEPYELVPDKVVLATSPSFYEETFDVANKYGYYLVAVDVLGNESEMSSTIKINEPL